MSSFHVERRHSAVLPPGDRSSRRHRARGAEPLRSSSPAVGWVAFHVKPSRSRSLCCPFDVASGTASEPIAQTPGGPVHPAHAPGNAHQLGSWRAQGHAWQMVETEIPAYAGMTWGRVEGPRVLIPRETAIDAPGRDPSIVANPIPSSRRTPGSPHTGSTLDLAAVDAVIRPPSTWPSCATRSRDRVVISGSSTPFREISRQHLIQRASSDRSRDRWLPSCRPESRPPSLSPVLPA